MDFKVTGTTEGITALQMDNKATGLTFDILGRALQQAKELSLIHIWEPETSVALGFGFRVGFLGLLHMEVVKERLEREFNLDLIATSPSVDYHVYKTDGEMLDVRSPQDLPEATRIERIEEPYLKAKIICPPEYTGAVMQLAIEHRGVTTDMIHLTSKSVEMRFDMPLAELCLLYTSRCV